MHRIFFLALLISCCTCVRAQEFERSFGLELTPHVNQRRISAGAGQTITQLNAIDSMERGSFGYGIGFVYETRTERLGFTTGLRYTRAGYQTLDQMVAGSFTESFRDEITAHYLSIPLELNFYQNVTDNDRVLFLMGVGGQYHLGTKITRSSFTEGDETGTDTFEDESLTYRSVVVSFITGIGYDRKLSSDWAIRFQPTFQFFLNGNLRPESELVANRNYYQIGLRVVIRKLFI